jgi:hypothetical protein
VVGKGLSLILDMNIGNRRFARARMLSLDNVAVDISGIECITPQGIRTRH